MDHIEISKELSAFIEESPSMFHTVEAVRKRLDAAGFRYLPETEQWDIEEGDRCYTVRNGSSIIAFRAGRSASGEKSGRGGRTVFQPENCFQKKFLAPASEADRSAGGSGGADLQYDTDQ